jgi:hypothetical protein
MTMLTSLLALKIHERGALNNVNFILVNQLSQRILIMHCLERDGHISFQLTVLKSKKGVKLSGRLKLCLGKHFYSAVNE